MISHIYPSVLQALAGRGYAGCLDGCFQGYRGEAMQDLGYDLPRILIPRTPVNPASGQCAPPLRVASCSWCRPFGEEHELARRMLTCQRKRTRSYCAASSKKSTTEGTLI